MERTAGQATRGRKARSKRPSYPARGGGPAKRVTETISKDERFTDPLYTVAEAAMYLRLPRTTLGYWVRSHGSRPPIVTTLGDAKRNDPVVPFVGLTEAYVASVFRRVHGLKWAYIRRAIVTIRQKLGLDYALASERLYTDGAQIVFDQRKRDADALLLVEVVSDNVVFTEVVRDYLQRINYEGGWASQLILPTKRKIAVVNPRRAFGQPLTIKGGARIIDLLDRFDGGESPKEIGEDFAVPEEDVLEILRVFHQAKPEKPEAA